MDDGGGALTATGLICGSCGTHCSSTGKFCNECGEPVAQATRSAEYKQVTVLFADVVRSMDLAAVLDMERLREVMTELLERSAAVAQRYGGTVEYTGDGVMAIFGAPVALEDDAFRACVAALAIHDEMKQLATEVQRRDEVALQVRVGLNSGRVIAGDIGSGSLARSEPALFIIEDAHWIDAVSESMIADLLTVIPHTQSMVLITSRPEYHGALTRVHGAQTIALAPLDDSDTAALLGELASRR